MFHAEHNRLVEETQKVLLGIDEGQDVADQDANITTDPLDLLNSFLLSDITQVEFDGITSIDDPLLVWNGDRLFQTAKFGTEMQYQHLVFEEFARKFQPAVNEFEGIDISIDPSITIEFSQAVYRLGHSMLVEEVDRFDPEWQSSEIGLIEAFLNPLLFNDAAPLTGVPGLTPEEAAGALVRGLTRQVGNEIDEFVTDAVRNNLLGLPLDLAAINIARGRDVGIPPLNAVRADFFEQTGLTQLKPYTSWVDFALHAKHELSVVNFIAAYGTHDFITSQTTLVNQRAAALSIVTGVDAVFVDDPNTIVDESDPLAFTATAPADAVAFLNSTGSVWGSNGAGSMTLDVDGVSTTGLGNIDLWIGGLAEAIMPFGGMLGSTFNFVFEVQLESLQEGDRFYYLGRTAGLNFLTELENGSFAEMIIRNTDATHLPGDVFSTPNWILEVDQTRQFNEGQGDIPGGDPVTIGESGTVLFSEIGADGTGSVVFAGPITDAVVVMMINTNADTDATVIRVIATSDLGFDFQFDEFDVNLSAGHIEETVSWIAISAGEHLLADGTVIKAGTTTATDDAVTSVSFGTAFGATPVVLTQVSSDADSETVTTRHASVTTAGFDINMQEQELNDPLHATETIGWIAIDQATGTTIDTGTQDISSTPEVIGFDQTFDAPSAVFLAQMQTTAEIDTAAVRGTILNDTDATVFVQEETAGDGEVAHIDETVGFVALNAGVILALSAPIVGAADPTETDSIFFDLVIRDDPSTPGVDTNYLQYTGGDHVVLGGTEGADILIGSIGDDTLYGDGGDDVLEGGDGGDFLFGGAGDDIITDLAGDDVIKGGDGNDAINAGNGDDLVLGGAGSDFILLGQDPGEVFGGSGNDFININEMRETPVFGGEGDDWIEGLFGVQISSGDNGAPLVDSTIIGNDVFIGGNNDDDFDGESGDDIMIGGGGIDRMEGMIGFDWATYMFRENLVDKTSGVVADMNIRAFNENQLPPSTATTGDRFDQVEGLSGTPFADILIGDDADRDEIEATLGVLTNFELIDGYRVGDNAAFDDWAIFAEGVMEWGEGNILLGGAGSDLLEGRGGDDIIDGDLWLNVQLEAPESVGGPLMRYDSMTELQARVFDPDPLTRLNPGDINIVREFLDAGAEGFNFDTAIFSDLLVNYTIEMDGLVVGDGDGDGYITVMHNPLVGVGDGTDLVRNIERLFFNDGETIIIDAGQPGAGAGASGDVNAEPMGMATIDNPTPAVGDVVMASVDLVTDGDNVSLLNPAGEVTGPVFFTWQFEEDPGSGVFIDIPNDGVLGNAGNNAPVVGETFTVIPLVAGLAIRVKAIYEDGNGVLETVFSAPTALVGGLEPTVPTEGDDILIGTALGETIDALAGNDEIRAGGGDDLLIGGPGSDLLDGGADDGTLLGDIAQFDGDFADFEILPVVNDDDPLGPLILEVVDINGVIPATVPGVTPAGVAGDEDKIINIETLRFNDQDVDAVALLATLVAQIATEGDDTLTGTDGDDDISGLGGNDTINALGGDDDITGGPGDDTINAGADDDTIFWAVGDGRDLIDGGDGTDRFRIQGDGDDETFFVETVADFEQRLLDNGLPDPVPALSGNPLAVIVSRGLAGPNGASEIIAELTNVEDIDINGGGGNDNFVVSGDFAGTDLDPNTITITGSDGDDTVDISGLDSEHRIVFDSNGGNDTIIGLLRPQDIVNLATGTELVYNGDRTFSIVNGDGSGNGNQQIFGTDGADDLTGTDGADSMFGLPGADIIHGLDGNDHIEGNGGEDELFGGAGNDILIGGNQSDRLKGGEGDDFLWGGSSMAAGGGDNHDDTAVFDGLLEDFFFDIDFLDPDLLLVVDLVGNEGADTLFQIEFLEFSDGTITLDDALLLIGLLPDPGIVHITDSTPDDGINVNDELTADVTYDDYEYNIEYQWESSSDGSSDWTYIPGATQQKYTPGSSQAGLFLRVAVAYYLVDMVTGESELYADQTVYSEPTLTAVVDVSAGEGSNESQGDGTDVSGNSGDENAEGSQGNDGSDGSSGDYGSNDGNVIYDVPGGHEIVDSTGGSSTIFGLDGPDVIYGGVGGDIIYGGDGNDVLFGGDGNDIMYGGAGNDTMRGGDGDDIMYGDAGNDTIMGEDGNDIIYGGDGNDVIDGGTGNDTMYGGAGADVFIYRPDSNDMIMDYQEGIDTLQILYDGGSSTGYTVTVTEYGEDYEFDNDYVLSIRHDNSGKGNAHDNDSDNNNSGSGSSGSDSSGSGSSGSGSGGDQDHHHHSLYESGDIWC
ncbi:leukotoxin [bacterium MnTg02]|nr:leukotoxin [bacterium MnTg02]